MIDSQKVDTFSEIYHLPERFEFGAFNSLIRTENYQAWLSFKKE
jgi:hypothetical protein